ncbi:hypothetical protein NPE20_03920 [Mucilaginibacter sp. JC4]|uniref:HNH domain-containing protein n=1 Tax=Mucilaginibacter aquariorum TaxID=2967225 RepID=A0ABT1SXL1_9SPHI|nr:hypothetical protein [Mucilaginibacter aquariorum]
MKIACNDGSCVICTASVTQIKIPKEMRLEFEKADFLEDLISAEPADQKDLCLRLWKAALKGYDAKWHEDYKKAKKKKKAELSKDDKAMIKKIEKNISLFERIFDYNTWFLNKANSPHYDAYVLAANLGRSSCTYCNRLYTSTMKTIAGKKVMRPTFDHWFPKYRYPMLGLSFYNLIPSCTICNSSIKGFKEFDTATHIHPYVDADVLERYRFSYDYLEDLKNFRVKIKSDVADTRIMKTYKDLKIDICFDAHHAELADLIRVREAYSQDYIRNMFNSYPGANLSFDEIYRLAFGISYEPKDFYKLPLSKFKNDIVSELLLLSFTTELKK